MIVRSCGGQTFTLLIDKVIGGKIPYTTLSVWKYYILHGMVETNSVCVDALTLMLT